MVEDQYEKNTFIVANPLRTYNDEVIKEHNETNVHNKDTFFWERHIFQRKLFLELELGK